MRSIGAYWGIGPKKESDWIKILGTTYDTGTPPKSIVQVLKDHEVSVKVKENLSIDDLLSNVEKGRPVLCPIQAWGNRFYYRDTWCGHWIIVIGFNEKYIYCEDSFIPKARGFIEHDKFINRWHDTDCYGKYWCQLGIIMEARWEPKKTRRLFKAAEIF